MGLRLTVGVNLCVLLEHDLSARELLEFPSRASKSPAMALAARKLWDVMRSRWPNLGTLASFSELAANEPLSADDIEAAWRRGDTPSFSWAGYHLYFGRHAIEATHLEKLAGFVLDLDALREPLRDCARALAGELGSSQVVYGPDSASAFEVAADGFAAGSTLAEILQVAATHCGPAASSIQAMANADEELQLERGCYCVELVEAAP